MLIVQRSLVSVPGESRRQAPELFQNVATGRCNSVRFRIAVHVPRARLEGGKGPYFLFEIQTLVYVLLIGTSSASFGISGPHEINTVALHSNLTAFTKGPRLCTDSGTQ